MTYATSWGKAAAATLLATATGVAAQTVPAQQQAAPAPSDTATSGIADIVVTAQRRSENVQNVPIAISALSGDYLRARDITSIDQLGSVAPNVKIERSPGDKTVSQISIRGSVTINPAITFEPAVGLYVDGVYIAKAQGSIFDVADIERVEVLRGPQGTLYGRNTLAGAVNFITRKPSGIAGGSAELTYGNFNERRVRASIDLPKVGIFSAKVSGQYERRDGMIGLIANPVAAAAPFTAPARTGRTDDVNGYGIFVQVRAQISDNLVADYSFDYSRSDQQPNFNQLYTVNRNGAPSDIFDPTSPGYSGIPLALYANRQRQDLGSIDSSEYERQRIQGHALTIALDLGAATLKSITAYRKLSFDDRLDLDGSPIPIAATERHTNYKSFSQELQLTGKAIDGKVNYVLGAYYFADDGFTNNPQSFFFGQSQYDSRYGGKTQAEAAYVQVDGSLTERLTLTGGLRYNHETKQITRYLAVLPALGAPASTPIVGVLNIPYGVIPKASYNDVSPAATLRYAITPAINAYARYAKGFKSGGFNGETNVVGAPTAACPSGALELCAPYRPETVDSYELGLKSRLLDNTLQFNLAAFWDEHSDIQLAAFKGNGSVATLILNAGAARIRGVEAEIVAKPDDRFTTNLSFAYLDTHYRRFIDGGVDVANNRSFPQAPKYTASVGTDWFFAKGNWGKAHLIDDLSFVSSYYTYPYALVGNGSQQQLARTTQSPGRTIVNARIQIDDLPIAGTHATLSVWTRNLFNENAPSNFIDFGPSFGGLTVANYPDPRTFGATIGVRF